MKSNFNPSINILRDFNLDFDYLNTSNSEKSIETINNNVVNGYRCFYIVGSYGTGKSSFLLALQKQLLGSKKYFKNKIGFGSLNSYQIVNIIGEYMSFEEVLRSSFNIKNNFFKEFEKHYNDVEKKGKALIILVDEFGKFLEFASKNNPEKTLYFLQTLAEFINDPKKKILFISTLHQSFDSYGFSLDQKMKHDWEKIKGRFKEILFNEPIEQLIFLAAKYIESKKYKPPTDLPALIKLFKRSLLVSSNYSFDVNIALKIYPLDFLSSIILTQALQNFGQNERSLFTFLFNKEKYGLEKYDSNNNPYYNLYCVYKYLINELYSVIFSRYNPDFIKWMNIKNSIERVDSLYPENNTQYHKIIVTVGLLNIFSNKGSIIDEHFLVSYCKYSLGVKNPKSVIADLVKKKILRYLSYKKSYILFDGTDLDIELELLKAENNISLPADITPLLNQYINVSYVQANSISIKKGTPRFFEFRINDSSNLPPTNNDVDGIVNLILKRKISFDEVCGISKVNNDLVLYAYYNNYSTIEKLLFQVEKLNYLIYKHEEDMVAIRELRHMKDYFVVELNHLLADNLFNSNKDIKWVYKGEEVIIHSKRHFNEYLSYLCEDFYPYTPNFNNELINRSKLSPAITSARRNLLHKLLNECEKENIGFSSASYPPEYSIYLSLIKDTGVHRKQNNLYILDKPIHNDTFYYLWDASVEFLDSTQNGKKSILSFYEILEKKPFKLKRGFLDFWIPLFLIINKDDFAVFDHKSYIPFLSVELFNLFNKKPGDYFIKAFNVKGIKLNIFNRYREIINKSSENKFSNKSFIETVKPFLVFYKNLPEYAKKTQRLSKAAIQLRDTIANAKEPEKTFFEDFPAALGFSMLKLQNSSGDLDVYVNTLQKAIKEIRESYSNLVNRVENNLINIINCDKTDFPSYKHFLSENLLSIKSYLLKPEQRLLLSKINSDYHDRDSWLNSMVLTIFGKQLNAISDKEEEMLYAKMNETINELYNFVDISKAYNKDSNSDIVKFELTTIEYGTKKLILNIPKNGEFKEIEKNIKKYLSGDVAINQKVLIKLLKEQISEE